MGQSLAVKYRPTKFEDVVGQNLAVRFLEKAIEQRNFKHAYLFAGDSGCGKTSCARVFAKAVNNGVGEPIEIDAASNNGVDQVRAIIDSANERSLDGEYKIFIIDECHAITTAGWQAFLKCIEETPEYTIFIFCTTEPNKLPQAILNRVQRYNITKVDATAIKERLLLICRNEGFYNYEGACDLISKTAHGCMRDAIMRLEQCADFSKDLSLNNVRALLPGVFYESMFNLTWALQDKDEAKLLSTIDGLYNSGHDLKGFIDSYLEFTLDLAKYILFKNIELTSIPAYLATADNPVVQQTVGIENGLAWVNDLADALLELKLKIKYDTSYKSTIEAFLLRFCR